MSAPYSLVSFWDMLNLPVGRFAILYARFCAMCRGIEHDLEHNYSVFFPVKDFSDQMATWNEFAELCRQLGFRTSADMVGYVTDAMQLAARDGDVMRFVGYAHKRLSQSLITLKNCVDAESQSMRALVLSPLESDLFEPATPHFGKDVRDRFPSAIRNIDEANKCLALGRTTASVFHLMRIIEVALKATHAYLGLIVSDRNWGVLLSQIRTERVRRGPTWVDKDYFQDLYARLDAIKDAWRNTTMHVENDYTEEEARLILGNVRGLMEKIASRMDEKGLPV